MNAKTESIASSESVNNYGSNAALSPSPAIAPTHATARTEKGKKKMLPDLNEPAPENEDSATGSQKIMQALEAVEEAQGSAITGKRKIQEGECSHIKWAKKIKSIGNWLMFKKVAPADQEVKKRLKKQRKHFN